MNDNLPLHWSFNYNFGAQKPDFAKELLIFLNEYKNNTPNDNKNEETNNYIKHVYEILPNFWRGYNRTGKTLTIGNVVIERNYVNGQIWNYNVQYQNTTSGEDIRFNFICRDDIHRTLVESWQVDVKNESGDGYSNLTLNGNLISDTEIQLHINDIEIALCIVDSSIPLTCNWALYDVIPTIANSNKHSDSSTEIVLLDDLEYLRPKCNLGHLDSIQQPFSLDGYFLYGEGVLPSYWWVDAKQTVVVSTVFETFVLKETTWGTL